MSILKRSYNKYHLNSDDSIKKNKTHKFQQLRFLNNTIHLSKGSNSTASKKYTYTHIRKDT